MAIDFKTASNDDIQKHIQGIVDKAVKKDRDSRSDSKEQKERFSRLYKDDAKELGTVTELLKSINEQTNIYRKSLQQLGGEGAFFVKGGPLQEGLNATIKKMDALTASPEKGAEAFKQLTVQIKNFAQLAKATEDAQGGLAASLAEQAAVLNDLGLSYGNFSKNVDFAIYSMGQSRGAVDGLNTSLVNLSSQIGMLPDDVSRNFQMVAKNLAYSFQGIKEQFVGIQRLSAETGVSIDNLMGKFGQRMDTISGASEMAAKINSLLGKNAFSATELLTMTEEERMTSIRDELMDSGAASTALGDGVQGKFALQSINEVLGLGLDDTRRFLQTGGLKQDITDKVSGDFNAGSMDSFTKATDKSADALEDFTNIILRFMTPAREQAIRSRREAMEKPSTLLGVGVFRDSGETGDINTAMINNLGFKDLMFTYNQDKTKANNLGVDEITLKGIAASINAGGASALKAQQEARNLNIMLGSSSAIRGGISPLQQSIIAKTPEKFGMRAALINQFRGGTTAAELGLDADSKKEDIRGAFDSTTGTFKKGGGAGPPQAQTRVPVLRPNFSYNPTVNVTVNGKPAENVLVEHLKPLDPDE